MWLVVVGWGMQFGISGTKSRGFAKAGLLVASLLASSALTPAKAQYPASQCVASSQAGGTSDALTIPAQPCGPTTTLLLLTTSLANATTSPTLQQLGYPAQPITQLDGSAVTAGEWGIGFNLLLQNTGSQWRLLTQPVNPNTVPYGRVVMIAAPNQTLTPTVFFPTFGQSGENLLVASGYPTSTNSSGLQEASDYTFAHHLSLDVYCPSAGSPPLGPLQGGNLGIDIGTGVTVVWHPLRQQYVRFHGCGINGNQQGALFQLDSGVEAEFSLADASQLVNNYSGSLGGGSVCGALVNPGACGILLKPTNPVIPENFVGWQSSTLDVGNTTVNAPNATTSDAALVLDATNGTIGFNKYIGGKELNCGGPGHIATCNYGYVERNGNGSNGIGYNVVDFGFIHLVNVAGMAIGAHATANLYQGSQYRVGSIQPYGASSIGVSLANYYSEVHVGNISPAAGGSLNIGVLFDSNAVSNQVHTSINSANFNVLDQGPATNFNFWCIQNQCSSARAQVFSSTLNLVGALSSVVGGGNYLCVDPNGLVYKKSSCP